MLSELLVIERGRPIRSEGIGMGRTNADARASASRERAVRVYPS